MGLEIGFDIGFEIRLKMGGEISLKMRLEMGLETLPSETPTRTVIWPMNGR